MKAINFKEVNVRIAENQEEYETLPVKINLVDPAAPTTMCIELDQAEINQVVRTGRIWLTVLTFKQNFHPIKMSLLKPDDCTDPGNTLIDVERKKLLKQFKAQNDKIEAEFKETSKRIDKAIKRMRASGDALVKALDEYASSLGEG